MSFCGSQLKKHRLTRRWVPTKRVEPTNAERELQEGLEWQCRVADALPGYTAAIADALEALARAHRELDDAGIEAVDDAALTVKGLLHGLQEAHEVVRKVAKSIATPLETHRTALYACADDIAHADDASAELLRYREKLGLLERQNTEFEAVGRTVAPKAAARLKRNRTKLQQADNVASVARTRARDSLHSCISRRGILCRLARDCVVGMEQALRTAVGALGTSPPNSEYSGNHLSSWNPFDLELSAEAIEKSFSPQTSAANPFATDVVSNGAVLSGQPLRDHEPVRQWSSEQATPLAFVRLAPQTDCGLAMSSAGIHVQTMEDDAGLMQPSTLPTTALAAPFGIRSDTRGREEQRDWEDVATESLAAEPREVALEIGHHSATSSKGGEPPPPRTFDSESEPSCSNYTTTEERSETGSVPGSAAVVDCSAGAKLLMQALGAVCFSGISATNPASRLA